MVRRIGWGWSETESSWAGGGGHRWLLKVTPRAVSWLFAHCNASRMKDGGRIVPSLNSGPGSQLRRMFPSPMAPNRCNAVLLLIKLQLRPYHTSLRLDCASTIHNIRLKSTT